MPSRPQQLIMYAVIFVLGWVSSWWFFSTDNIRHNKVVDTNTISTSKVPTPSVIDSVKPAPQSNDKRRSTASLSDYDKAKRMLANSHYSKFIQFYIGIRATVDEKQIAELQGLLLNEVRSLQKRKAYKQSLDLLTLFIEYEYDNTDALMLFAELQHIQKNYLASMDALFRARSYAHQSQKIDEVNKKLRALIAEQRKRLDQQDDKLPVLDFYRRLTELEPDYAPNFVGLAEVYLSLGNPDDARHALSVVSRDLSVSDSVARVYEKLDNAPALDLSGATSVPLLRVHNQFLIDVVINNQQSARLLLDTGASISIISPSISDGLGLTTQKANRIGWFNTANGVVSAPIYSLRSLAVENYQIETIDVGVLSVSDSNNIDGLLGMNFLKHFKFFIDQQKNVLYLR